VSGLLIVCPRGTHSLAKCTSNANSPFYRTSLSLSLSLSLILSLTLTFSLSLYHSLFLAQFLSLSITPSCSLSISLSLSLPLPLSLSLSLSLILSTISALHYIRTYPFFRTVQNVKWRTSKTRERENNAKTTNFCVGVYIIMSFFPRTTLFSFFIVKLMFCYIFFKLGGTYYIFT
jgi:hypothetical protein